jgi:hypothetical protein
VSCASEELAVPTSAARLTLLLVCAAAFAPRSAAAEPPAPKFRPEYTAFPDLKPGRELKDITQPDGTTERVVIENPVVVLPRLAELPPGAPLIRRVQYEQARAGLDYLTVVRQRADDWTFPMDLLKWQSVAMRVFPLAAKLEPSPTNRVLWYEAQVRLFKEVEGFVRSHALRDSFPPWFPNMVRFYRLSAEIELLDLLAELKRSGAPPRALPPAPVLAHVPAPSPPAPPGPARRRRAYPLPPAYTAFPDLRWDKPHFGPNPERAREDPDARIGRPPTDLPVLPANAPRLDVLRRETTLEAFAVFDYLSGSHGINGGPGPEMGFETAAEAYRLAADLEPRLADRVAWYDARVRALKGWVIWNEIRVSNGSIQPSNYLAARFEQLQVEVDLLRLLAQHAATTVRGEAPFREEINIGTRTKTNTPPAYTAFPTVRAPVRKVKEQRANGLIVYEWVDAVKRPEVSAPRADAPTRVKLRYEQVSEGLEYIDRVQRNLFAGHYFDATGHVVVLADVYRSAVDLANGPAERTRWLEQQVRDGKLIEEWTDFQTRTGAFAPYTRAFVRVHRLKAEIELLKPQFVAEQNP